MAPSFVTIGAAALAWGVGVRAAVQTYQLSEAYDSTNFFDKFNFIESKFDTGNYNDVDPNSGYVWYRSKADATDLGLIHTFGDEMFIGVDHAHDSVLDVNGRGRSSVRLESKALYNHGLFIVDFTHLPPPVCGSWPAFWTFGDPWPKVGEIDIYESWNLDNFDRMTLHTGKSSENGTCTISQPSLTNEVHTPDCDSYSATQYANEGCSTYDKTGPYGEDWGGVYAMQWTSDFIQLWSWDHDSVPKDVTDGAPDPSKWGTPKFTTSGGDCDIDSHFANQKLVFNIDFCGSVAGNEYIWNPTCSDATGYDQCVQFVANRPDAFNSTNFRVRDVKIYDLKDSTTSSSSASSSSTSSSSSSTSSVETTTTTSYSSTSTSSDLSTSTSWSVSSTSTSSADPTSTTTSDDPTSTSTSSADPTSTGTSSADPTSTTSSADAASTTESSSSSSSTDTASSTSSWTETSTSAADPASTTDSSSSSSTSTSAADPASTSSWTESATSTSSYSSDSTSMADDPTSTSSAAPTATSSDEPLVTSTITTTNTYTITSCAPTVTDCPVGKVTEEVTVYTTVCPATEAAMTSSTPAAAATSSSLPEGYTTSTVYVTKTYTITSCKPTVTDCPVGKVTSTVIAYTTVCPVAGGAGPSKYGTTTATTTVLKTFTKLVHRPKPTSSAAAEAESVVYHTKVVVPVPTGYNTTKPYPTGGAPAGSGSSPVGCTGAGCGKVAVGAAAGVQRNLAGGALAVVLAAVAVWML